MISGRENVRAVALSNVNAIVVDIDAHRDVEGMPQPPVTMNSLQRWRAYLKLVESILEVL